MATTAPPVVNGNDDVSQDLLIDMKESELHRHDSLTLLLYTLLLTLTVLTVWLFKHRRIRYLHETGLAIFYGLVVGAIIRYGMGNVGDKVTTSDVRPTGDTGNIQNGSSNGSTGVLLGGVDAIHSKTAVKNLTGGTTSSSFEGEVRDATEVNEIDQKATFDPEIFFNVLLPPIIFHAGYSMKKRFFFRNIGSILALAFVGTVVSTFVVGGVMYGVATVFPHLKFSLLDSLHFGALISATDPVTVLAIFNDLSVDVNLYALVFGESVLNDAVAIVLTRTLEDYEKDAKTDGQQPAYAILLWSVLEFVGIFGASFLVGSVMASTTALLTKFTHIKQFPQLESSLFVLMSYSTFLLAESMKLTGIVSVLFCGICQAHYTYNNLSEESRSITKQFFGLLNFMAENFIFSYIGVSLFTFPKHKFDLIFIIGSFVAIILGRALNIYPLSFILNFGRKTKISMNVQHMLFLSGLRGAIAFALAIRNTLTESRQMILTTTLLIVIVTVAVCGGSTLSLLTWLGIPIGVGEEESAPLASPSPCYDEMIGEREKPSAPPGKSWLAKVWSSFDNHYMKPFLTHSNPTLMETLPQCCLPLARMLTSQDQLARHPALQIKTSEEDAVVSNDIQNDTVAVSVPPTAFATGTSRASDMSDDSDGGSHTKDFLSKQIQSHI